MKPAVRKITVLATGATLLVGAPAAFAQQLPAVNGYSAPAAAIQTQVTPTTHTPQATTQSTPAAQVQPAAQTSSNQLPFTGLDVGLAVLAGAVLLALGFGIRRLARPPAA